MCPQCTLRVGVSEAPTGRGYVCKACLIQFGDSHERKRLPKRETTRGRSSRQERFNARGLGGELTANSGAGRDKGDIKIRGVLREEDKTTVRASFVLQRADLRKVAAAAQGDEIPVMRISFEDNLREQYVVVPGDWFDLLLASFRRGA
jgi:hypothetical protein